MIIELSETDPPRLTDLDRFDRLHATKPTAGADVAWSELCHAADDDHVWLDILAARRLVAAHDAASVDQYDAMIEYAGTKGWIDDDGRHVRAHVADAG